MQYKRFQSIALLFIFLVAASLAACGSSPGSEGEIQTDTQDEDRATDIPTWQYKMTIVTNYGRSDALQENGTVVFDGTFSVLPSGVIESHEGRVTVSGNYRCRELNSDPPRMLEGTLTGEHSFSVDGSLIPAEDYNDFDVIPLEPLTADETVTEYALLSIPKVSDRTRVSVDFGRENCTGSDFTPVVAEVVSFGEIPFFIGEYIPFFVVPLFPNAAFEDPIELNDEGSQVLSEAKICVAPSGLCP